MADIDDQLSTLAAIHQDQDQAQAAAVVEIRRIERKLGEALGGRSLLHAPVLAGRRSRGFEVAYAAWRIRGAPDSALPYGSEQLVLVPRGFLVMAEACDDERGREGGIRTRVAEDADLQAGDLEALLEVLRGVLSLTAAGRRGEAADRVRDLAKACARALDPPEVHVCRADRRLDELWTHLRRLPGGATPEVDDITSAIGGPR